MIAPLPVCILCGRRADAVHDDCRERVDHDLTRIPVLHAQLAEVLEPGAGTAARVSGSRTAPLPVRLEPLSLRGRGGIATILGTWVTDWRDVAGMSPAVHAEREQLLAGDAAVTVAVRFLRAHLDWAIQRHPAVEEFADETRHIVHACRLALGDLQDAMRIGDCPALDGGRPCGAQLWAFPNATAVHCERCGAQWPRTRWPMLGLMLAEAKERAA